MTASVLTTPLKWNELPISNDSINFLLATNEVDFLNCNADIYINLLDNAATFNYNDLQKLLIINSVVTTTKHINAKNVVRINGWDGFLKRPVWEVAGSISNEAALFFASINKKIITSKDEPGFITARVLCMIINEAWFALEAGVSTKQEIDIAMKLGTNYPLGPFEWGEKIGLNNVVLLLNKLSETENKYTPCNLLTKAISV